MQTGKVLMIQIGKAWQIPEAVTLLDILFDYTWEVMNLKSLTLSLDTSAQVLG